MAIREQYTQGTPNWIDLSTTDPEGAKAFYGQLMGWDFAANPTPDGGEYIMASLAGKSAAGLMQQAPQQAEMGVPPLWNTYIAVDDVAAAAGAVEAAGGSIMMPPMTVMDSGHMAVGVDPTGAVFGMWQAEQHIGCEVVNEPGALTWNELINADLPTAAPFYAEVFGVDVGEQDMGPEAGIYTLFNVGEAPVAGGMAPPMDGIPNHWSVYFHVEDVDTTVARAQDLGGTVVAPAFPVPTVGKMAGLQDPQGATFWIMQPEAEAA